MSTDKQLFAIWRIWHQYPRWLDDVEMVWRLNEFDAERICDIDDAWAEWAKGAEKVQRESAAAGSARLYAEVRAENPGWVKQRRLDYLEKSTGQDRGKLSMDMERDITQSDIDKARKFDLARLVKPNGRGYILCPLHPDKAPSMWIRGGFGYCFACQGHLDAIEYLIRVKGISFKDAVRQLAS